MARTDENFLDLSAWPAPPSRLGGVPPRPTHRARPTLLTPARGAAVLGVLASALLLVPAGRCGTVLSAVTALAHALPSEPPPSLDPRIAAADKAAVARAQPKPTAARIARSTHVVDPAAVQAATAAVSAAQHENDAAAADLDRLLAAQQSSSNPASYDDSVAAAQDRLDESQSALDDANSSLTQARAGTTKTSVVRVPAPDVEQRQELAAAEQTEAAHVAAAQRELQTWRADRQSAQLQVNAYNSRVRGCSDRAAVPAGVGGGLLVASGGLGVYAWRKRK